jgi:hypothetical protein
MRAALRFTRVYVAGPMTGLPELNFPAFHAATERLRERGYIVVNPAELSVTIKPEAHDWEARMRIDLAEMMRCDVVALLPGWSRSRGATLEESTASAVGIPTMHVEALLAGDYTPQPAHIEEIAA